MKDVLTAILFIMLMVLPSHGAFGVELFGAGSPEVALAFSTLAEDYLFTRDDVSIKYSEMGTSSVLTAYGEGLVDFASFDRAVPADLVAKFGDYVQFPIVGVALTMAYRLSEFNASDPNITLDRETLGRIWSGSISSWNDSAIQQLNPLLAARLPNRPIQLGLVDDSALSVSQIAKIGLSSFSAEFAGALAAANNTFALMAPLFGGRATVLSTNTSARTNFLKNTDGGMTFITYPEAVAEGLRWANMINLAGQEVAPGPDAVRAAMQDFTPAYNAGQFAVDIVDGNGSASWPLAFTSYFSLSRNITAVDCTNVEELLNWLAWVLTNDAADSALRKVKFAPLDTVLATKLLALMNTVQCNSEQAYVTSYIVGTGPAMPIYTSWSVAYAADDVDVKYYTDDDATAKQQLVDYDEDFAASSNGLAAAWRDKMPDAALMPVIAYAIVPGYHLPELVGLTEPLVLNFDTLAAIYENNLTMWDDERIKAINSAVVAAALPHQAIVVITESIDSAVTHLFTSVLSATVPEFNATVGTGTLVNFPVLAAGNRSITTASPTGVIDELVATPYSFAFWDLYDITLSRSVSAASLINTSGNTVAANVDSVVSAINDYLASSATHAFDTLSLGGEGAGSWPLAAFGSFLYRSTSMTDCVKAAALADFLLWTQTSATSLRIAKRQGFVLASSDAELKKRFFDQLKAFTCAGVPVSSVYGCISGSGSELCSGFGSCVSNSCLCNSGREGQYCQLVSSSSAADSLAVILGVVLPVAAAIALLLCLVAVAAWYWARLRRGGRDDWEINYDELEVGDLLGSGGYGEVHRAMWKGTEVAVKVIASEKITKEMEKNFKDEVQVMTALRHPNVVLFMAASTKAPRMCIVMEYMGLGCLYELLHNELIPEIPFPLKAKMAYQGAKGMHFLHSSGTTITTANP
ncbi:phosphate ABC transporter, phosphatebinding protein PstS, putative [Acanthamoeba castellanii str. Neff]|uniref:non-specific serine/threonine protein kinase n=1 Tax=Acanthamoeba castellanii (strain ATCC 30010 / Neff) TaxID=1257118 RepID=L8GSS8_ACACF|nr:phosphate ABC transporter, phosphatebinding protein PstS, putative [Acanthamoeba castellanii str. Neff]ELR15997.1 phosphate ABC transporter, phosphatebinding protein PstS, putative [Acanthamoeba castellanii str. Neff]